MATKLKIRVGAIEFEYEGDSDFSQEAIKDLFSHIETLSSSSVASAPRRAADAPENESPPPEQPRLKLHVSSIASKISAETGPELAVSAAAYLQIVEGKEKFTRHELLATMKLATSRYKQAMSGNLSNILSSLINGQKFNQVANDTYALNIKEMQSLEAKLSD